MSDEIKTETAIKPPSLWDALFPMICLVVLIGLSIYLYGIDATSGPLQVALLMGAVVAALVAHKNGHSWERIATSIVEGISVAMTAIFILLMVGALIGVWNMSGTIATIVYYGIQFLSANWFYFAAALICALVGLVTGSSWTTAATIGVALVGISKVIGVSPEITAGAVISGAYCGDKMSPLSETTILAPQLVGSNIYLHIRSMAWSTIPAMVISLAIFAFIGFTSDVPLPPIEKDAALAALSSAYNINILTLLPVVVLLILSLRRYPAFLTILAGALTGALVAVVLQPDVVLAFANAPQLSTPLALLKGVWSAMATGFTSTTGIAPIDKLFSGGGMTSMLSTVWLVLGAMSFGAVMQHVGFTDRLVRPLIVRAKSVGALIATVMGTSIGLNIFAGDQYIAVILPAGMYRVEFQKRRLHPETLATAVENSGTVTSPLVPWNSCGAYMTATLGVSTFLYFPYCIFNLVNPLLGLIYGFTGFKVVRLEPEKAGEAVSEGDEGVKKPDEVPAPAPVVLAAPHVPVSK
ncbi:MAG: Na+/H+ antiporter NhaC family protein [Chloroflexia bacterium]